MKKKVVNKFAEIIYYLLLGSYAHLQSFSLATAP